MQRYQKSVGFSSIQESSKDQLSSVSFSQDTHAGAQEGPDGSAHTSTSQRFLLLWVLWSLNTALSTRMQKLLNQRFCLVPE